MRRTRVAAAIVLVACGLLAAVISSAGSPTPASAAGTTTSTTSTTATAPSATTGTADSVSQSSATLSGTVNPNGQATTYYFAYGTSTSYGTQTSPSSAGS